MIVSEPATLDRRVKFQQQLPALVKPNQGKADLVAYSWGFASALPKHLTP